MRSPPPRVVPMPASGPSGARQRLVVLLICSMSLFMTYVDATGLNVALPTIQHSFDTGVAALQWVADAYQLVLASLLMLSGSVADRLGRRRVFSAGLLVFVAGSALCSLSPGIGALVGFRMAQALGGCMLVPVSLSIVRQVYTDPKERARALGVWSAVFGLGMASGPIIGGVLVTTAGWRSVFWVNVPVGLAVWALARRFVPESRAPVGRRVDIVGQLLALGALSAITYGIIEGPDHGWTSAGIVGPLCLGGACAAALVAVERRVGQPLLEMRFFRSPPFSVANVAGVASYAVQAGFLFVITIYLQDVRHDSALVAGLSLLPATAVVAASAPLSGRLLARSGPRVPLALSGLSLAGGAALLLGLAPATPYPTVAVAFAVLGLGMGLVNPPITNTAVSGMPPEQAGVASAVTSISRQVGSVLGVAVMGSLVTGAALAGHRLHGAAAAHFTAASHADWVLAAACGLACCLLALAFTGPRGLQAAARVYHDHWVAPPAAAGGAAAATRGPA